MLRTIIYFSIIYFCSCKNEKQFYRFEFPEIIQLDKHDTVEYLKPKGILGVYPTFVNKFKFSKEIQINFDSLWKEQFDTSDFIYSTWELIRSDSFNNDGFQIIADFNTDIAYTDFKGYKPYHYVFPVYIINETNKTKLLTAKDSWVFATKEAKFENLWKPIEKDGFDFCGNGAWGLKIHPNEFAMFLMKKYNGNYKTQLRTKLRIGENWYLSKPYEGFIDTIQFLPKSYINKPNSK
jgi:hypothetical protein